MVVVLIQGILVAIVIPKTMGAMAALKANGYKTNILADQIVQSK